MSNVHIINVAQTPTSLSEKVNPMSIAFQKSTKEEEEIANKLSALKLMFSFCAV